MERKGRLLRPSVVAELLQQQSFIPAVAVAEPSRQIGALHVPRLVPVPPSPDFPVREPAQIEVVDGVVQEGEIRGRQMLQTFVRMAEEDASYQEFAQPTDAQTQQYNQRMAELLGPVDGTHAHVLSHLLSIQYANLLPGGEAQRAFRILSRQVALKLGYQRLVYDADRAHEETPQAIESAQRLRSLNRKMAHQVRASLRDVRRNAFDEGVEFSPISPTHIEHAYQTYVFQTTPLRLARVPGERVVLYTEEDAQSLFARASERLLPLIDRRGSVGISHAGHLYHDIRTIGRDRNTLSEMIRVQQIMHAPISEGLRTAYGLFDRELQRRTTYATQMHRSILPHMLGVDTFEQLPAEVQGSVLSFSHALMRFSPLPSDTPDVRRRGDAVQFARAIKQFRRTVVAYEERGGTGGIRQHLQREISSRLHFKGQVYEVLETEIFARQHVLRHEGHGVYAHANFPGVFPQQEHAVTQQRPALQEPSPRESLSAVTISAIAERLGGLTDSQRLTVQNGRKALDRIIINTQLGTDLHVWSNKDYSPDWTGGSEIGWLNTMLTAQTSYTTSETLRGQTAVLDEQDRFIVLARGRNFADPDNKIAVLVPAKWNNSLRLLSDHFPGVDFIPIDTRVTDGLTRFYVESYGFIPVDFSEGIAAFTSQTAAGIVKGQGDERVDIEAGIIAQKLGDLSNQDPLAIRQQLGFAQSAVERAADFVVGQRMNTVAATVRQEVANVVGQQDNRGFTRLDSDIAIHVRKRMKSVMKLDKRTRALTRELQERERMDLQARLMRPTRVVAQVARAGNAQFVLAQRTGAGNVYIRHADNAVTQTMRPALVEAAFTRGELTATQADVITDVLSTIETVAQARHELLVIAQRRIEREIGEIDGRLTAMQEQQTGAIRINRHPFLRVRRQNLAAAREAINRMFDRAPVHNERVQGLVAQEEMRLLSSRIVRNMIPQYLRKLPEYAVEIAENIHIGRVEDTVQRVVPGDIVIVASESLPVQLVADAAAGKDPEAVMQTFTELNQTYDRYRNLQVQLTHNLEGNPIIAAHYTAEQAQFIQQLDHLHVSLYMALADRTKLQTVNISRLERWFHTVEMALQQIVQWPVTFVVSPVRTINGQSGPFNPQQVAKISAEIMEVQYQLDQTTGSRTGFEARVLGQAPSVMSQLQNLGQIHLPRQVTVAAFTVPNFSA